MRSVLLLVASLALLGACKKDTTAAGLTLRVGATPVPHEEILRQVQKPLAEQGIKLEIVVFNDYVQPNLRLIEGDLDANFYQTIPYFDNFVRDHEANLTWIGKVHLEPFALYSRKLKSLSDVPDGATVAVPNELSNRLRALRLLEKAGLIKLRADATVLGSDKDILENPRHLQIKELDSAMLPRTLDSVDIAGINANFALIAGLVPARDGLLVEDQSAPFANVLVVRRLDQDKPALRALINALQSEAIRKFIQDKYQGAVVPAF